MDSTVLFRVYIFLLNYAYPKLIRTTSISLFPELCDAAAKIQAAFRGHLTRKVVTKETPDDDDIQEITKKVAEELDIDLSDPELHKAATKIQASFRGHKIRKDITE